MSEPQAPLPQVEAERVPSGAPPPAPPKLDVPPGASPPLPAGRPRWRNDAGSVAGLVLIGVGMLLLFGREIPDLGRYFVLVVGLGLLALFVATREYGALVPACIVTGVGAGIPLAAAYPGRLGGGLFMVAFGTGFLAIWLLGGLFRLREHHWWPLVPGVILGSLGATSAAGERGRPLADAIATGWPIALVLIGLWLMSQAMLRRGG